MRRNKNKCRHPEKARVYNNGIEKFDTITTTTLKSCLVRNYQLHCATFCAKLQIYVGLLIALQYKNKAILLIRSKSKVRDRFRRLSVLAGWLPLAI